MGTDRWADWLRSRRDGGDPGVRRAHEGTMREFRDGVLDRAAITEGDVVLDLGTGSGLIAFGALERVGGTGRVIFSDVSADLLAECRAAAAGDPRCAFMLMPADDLAGLPDASVDVVTSRSVLMYLSDKPRAFAECARVLRPGGRLSIFEPINRFAAGREPDALIGIDLSGVRDLAVKVLSAYRDAEVIVDFDERDLLRWVEEAGFTAIELDYRAQVAVPAEAPPADWAVLKRTAPNPLAPTYEEAIAATLTPDEQAQLDEFLTARLALGGPRHTTLATAYLRAVV